MARFPLMCALLGALVLAGCAQDRRYPLKGQVLAIDTSKQEITVKHDDIPGFMPGMTMPFKVSDARVLAERRPGDLITATLVVTETAGRLEGIVKTGEAPLPEGTSLPISLEMIPPGAVVPDAQFVDQAGRPRTLQDWRGKTLAVTFIYTRCPIPDFCPLMDRQFAAAQRAISQDPQLSSRVHLLSVSFDPDHDTPDVLKAHAEKVGADPTLWSYVTGDRAGIDAFAGAFGVAVMRGDQPLQEIMHNLRTAVISPDGRLATTLNGNEWTPEQLVAAIREADARR